MGSGKQPVYLRHYLADLNVQSVLEEPNYFDRDYLSEFSSFYGVSSHGYINRCRRCRFFSYIVDRKEMEAALGGDADALGRMREHYRGFVVLRPIPTAPLGRTVLSWYPDPAALTTPRVTKPSRVYECLVAGLTLGVKGIAWQQQDTGVSACATVALWSMLHSSAFDAHHAIPTTADITRYAHRTASLGSRVFPSDGLTVEQAGEAIKESGLEPEIVAGDYQRGNLRGFTRDKFSACVATLIRSGYPVLIGGRVGNSSDKYHAVCAVGFRECSPPVPTAGSVNLQDSGIRHLYLHDDNLGPSVRFEIRTDPSGRFVRLKASAPSPLHRMSLPADPTSRYPELIPSYLIAAVHENLRTRLSYFLKNSRDLARDLLKAYAGAVRRGLLTDPKGGLTVCTRFAKVGDYVGADLEIPFGPTSPTLGRVRLELAERVPPMSLYVGVVRIGRGAKPLMEVLFDTTDANANHRPFCNLQFDPTMGALIDLLQRNGTINLGITVKAY
ncbi:MAG: hypothetical protein IT350_04510 [Deltaproteobacteria bacterium]|nr:hypothetical protein [Deltaproteobacteria bacterium]